MRCRSATPSPTSSARSARPILLAQLGPKLIGVDLPAACAEYERQMGGVARLRAGRLFRLPRHRGARLRASTPDRPAHGPPGPRAVPGSPHLRRARAPRRSADRRRRRHRPRRPATSPRSPDRAQALIERVEAVIREVDDPGLLNVPGDGGRRLRHAARPSTARRCASWPTCPSRAASTCARSRATWSRSRCCPKRRSCAATS